MLFLRAAALMVATGLSFATAGGLTILLAVALAAFGVAELPALRSMFMH